jgi:ubiquitin related modifier 1
MSSQTSSNGTQSNKKHLPVTVEFSGGLDLLTGNRKKIELQLPLESEYTAQSKIQSFTCGALIRYVAQEIIKERQDLFYMNRTVLVAVAAIKCFD